MLNFLIGAIFIGAGAAIFTYFWMNKKLQKSEHSNIKLQVSLDEQSKTFANIEQQKSKMSDDFDKIARHILGKDKAELNAENQALLKPLNEQLKTFRERMEVMSKGQSDDRSALKQELRTLSEASQNTIKSADKLTNALTYDNKQQGDWGEMVLESILQDSGLKKDQEYHTQKTLKDDDGRSFKPDIIVHLPDDKDIVIDSKVSLVAYQNYVADTNNSAALKAHIDSIDNHIKNISLKAYENLKGVHTLDFIFVFFPIEASLLVALEQNPRLFNDALKKNVALVSPSTLMMSLKTVHHIWQTERQNKNTEKIAEQAGKMYDEFVRFVETMADVEKHLKKALESQEQATKRLTTGRGNLTKRAKNLTDLGVQSKKQLSSQ